MDTDQKKLTLQDYFVAAKAEGAGLNIAEFLTGLDAYIILPDEAAPLIAELHGGPTEELLDRLLHDIQIQIHAPEAQGLTQSANSAEAQSAVPVVPVTEGRRQAHKDLGNYVKENITWRRKIAQDFISQLRNDRLYGKVDEKKVQQVIEKVLKEPIYEKDRKLAGEIFAERVSREELFIAHKEEAKTFFESAAEKGAVSFEETVQHKATVKAIEVFEKNPTLEDIGPVLRSFRAAKTDKDVELAVRKANIFVSVNTPKSEVHPAKPISSQEFTTQLTNTLQNNGLLIKERLAVDEVGKQIVNSGVFDRFLKNSDRVTHGGISGAMTGFMAPAYTPETGVIQKRDMDDYVEAIVRQGFDPKNPDASNPTPTLQGFNQAVEFASHPEQFHFDFSHLPMFHWTIKTGAKKAGATVLNTVVKESVAATAKKYGTSFLLKLGFSATSKVVLGLSSPIGFIILAGITFSGTIKKIGGSALSSIAAGGLPPLRAASGAFSEFIQNALGTKYEDPNAANGWLLALGLAILPFLLAFLFTATTIQVQRSSFLPIGVEGGQPGDVEQQLFNISISATPVPGAGGIPSAIIYTVAISSLNGGPITINTLNISFSIFGGSGSTPATQTISGSQISGGSYTFTIPIGAAYDDSLVTAVATANVDTAAQSGIDGSSSVSTIIGNPPTGCFVFGKEGQADAYGYTSSEWDNQANVIGAISILAASPEYLSKYVCVDGPITLYRVKADFGGGSTSGSSMIFLYDACVLGSQRCMTYTMAHESGHIVNNRSASPMGSFHSQGISNREGYLRTYPNCRTESEDFAETIGDFVVWKYYPFGARERDPDCDTNSPGGALNYPQEYPLHYQFAKNLFKVEY